MDWIDVILKEARRFSRAPIDIKGGFVSPPSDSISLPSPVDGKRVSNIGSMVYSSVEPLLIGAYAQTSGKLKDQPNAIDTLMRFLGDVAKHIVEFIQSMVQGAGQAAADVLESTPKKLQEAAREGTRRGLMKALPILTEGLLKGDSEALDKAIEAFTDEFGAHVGERVKAIVSSEAPSEMLLGAVSGGVESLFGEAESESGAKEEISRTELKKLMLTHAEQSFEALRKWGMNIDESEKAEIVKEAVERLLPKKGEVPMSVATNILESIPGSVLTAIERRLDKRGWRINDIDAIVAINYGEDFVDNFLGDKAEDFYRWLTEHGETRFPSMSEAWNAYFSAMRKALGGE